MNPISSIRGGWQALALAVVLWSGGFFASAAELAPPPKPVPELVRAVDLHLDEETEVALFDGSKVRVKLLAVEEVRDSLRQAVRAARVRVELNGASVTLTSATYHLPVTVAGVQVDCPITRGYTDARRRQNVWALTKDARLRLWPAGSPWMQPGSFGSPVNQRWFASDTQMANEPTFVNGDETLGPHSIYYHWGLDFGGAEALAEVQAATDGLVVSAAGQTLPDYTNSPVKPRYDVIYVLDGCGWYYRYSHLHSIEVRPGQPVRLGQRLGLLGKEGGSGGWAHLHFDITRRQPSGEWGIEEAYAYAWEAWRNENRPSVMAVARPHHLAAVGEKVLLDGSRSWSRAGGIKRFDWQFTDGSSAAGVIVERAYACPGTYSEILKVTDAQGGIACDFAVVQVLDSAATNRLPPTIHAARFPTDDVRVGDSVTFKVRSFRTQEGAETWDFGDGSPRVTVKSDGNRQVHARDGYAVAEHRYTRPGHYVATVQRANARGEEAVGRLHVRVEDAFRAQTRVSLRAGRWHLNERVTYPGTRAEGLLMNVRMVNATFEDRAKPDFDPEANTDRFLAAIPAYAAHGARAFTLCLQGGFSGYEGAFNSAFHPDGRLRDSYLRRLRRVIEACDRQGLAVILGCFYQRQDQVLADAVAVRAGVVNAAQWIQRSGFSNVVLEIANEFDHDGFDHRLIRTVEGEIELIRLAKQTAPGLLVSTSGLGHGRYPEKLAEVADFLLVHFNGTRVEEIPARLAALKKHGKPIVCNEDDKTGDTAARAAELCVANGASWGLMLKEVNQYFPFQFHGAADDAIVYRRLKEMTLP